MDKTFILYVAVGLAFIYFIINFLGDLQKEDDKLSNQSFRIEHQYDKYQEKDSIGRDILVLSDVDEKTQIEAWQKSKLKKEFLELFPDFDEMKRFVKERIRGDEFKQKLLKTINETETGYFGGSLNAEDAKKKLDTLK
ncbi:MAG: hypothetical protein IE885_04210 [Campylobacterales bacterium]|nr:hypothetical protein [Campylobacterales bacterium]